MPRFEVPQKRARPSSQAPTPSQYSDPIVISSDESDNPAPAPKRKRSTPPVTNGSYSSALLQRAAAKTATSAASLASSMRETPSASQPEPESRATPPPKQDAPQKKSSPFKFPSWTLQAAKERAAQSQESSRNTRESSSQPATSRGPQPDSKPKHSTSSDLKRSASPRVKARLSTPSALNDRRATTPSQQAMRGPTFNPRELDSKRTQPDNNKSSDDDAMSEDSESEVEILKQFQKPVPAALLSNGVAHPPVPTSNSKSQEPNFQLAVPLRPTPSPAKDRKPSSQLPTSSQNFSLQVPLDRSGQSMSNFQAEKAAMFQELKKSTDVAKQRLPEVEKYFGQTGFSSAFDTNERERMMRAGPVYKRTIDWSKIDFDDFRDLSISDDDEETKERKRNMTDREAAGPMPDERLKVIMDRLFADHPDPPLTFRNDINDRRTPGNFQFMHQYVIRDGVKVAPPTNNRGCNCQGQCIPSECSCLLRDVQVDPFDPSNKATYKKIIRTYYQHPDDPSLTVLRPDYIANELEPSHQHYEITECNELCGCDSSCWNRVVGRGRTLSLEIYMTEHCGFGVRCPGKDILKGQFIDLYLGEVITQDEVEYRQLIKHPDTPSYLYDLDWFSKSNCYVVDGERFGSPMRFVNHSCAPNTRSFTVQTHHGDKHVYHLAFFAIKDIPAGEQITIDYHGEAPQAEESEEEEKQEPVDVTMSGSDETHDAPVAGSGSGSGSDVKKKPQARVADVKPPTVVEAEEGRSRCYCGSSNCRIWLWREPSRKRKRRTQNQ